MFKKKFICFNIKAVFLFSALVVLGADAFAQQYLVLENMRTGKRQRFYPGTHVNLLVNEERQKLSGTLYQVTDSTLLVDDVRIFLHQVEGMRFERVMAKAAVAAGLGMVAFTVITDGANQLFNENEGLSLSRGGQNLVLVGSAVALVALPFVRYKSVRGNKYTFKIFNHDPIIPRSQE
ncbi:MAG: hypothetical protein ACXITV_01150 [Luteibaculaceae bacterium]